MLLGIIIAVAGLIGVGTKYYNRDDLAGTPSGLTLALYVGAAVLAIAAGVAVVIILNHGTDACGIPGAAASRCN